MTTWEAAAAAKRDAILRSIPSEWRLKEPIPPAEQLRDVTGPYIQQFLDESEISITELDVVTLAEKTITGSLSAEAVIRAFGHRAALAHQFTNCLHEFFFDAALKDAKKLDEYLATNGKPVGPLHGVPVSLKDQCHVKGVDTSMGYIGWIGTYEGHTNHPRYRTFESTIVTQLRNLGAVLFAKTSVPHTLLAGEVVNNIIGYTWNPKNRLISAGGSSGGEGALIALKGSPVGIGTDIGGSIRIPAAFCGFFGLRPSTGRLPYQGMSNSMDGQNSAPSVVGPMAGSVAGLKLMTKALLSQKPWLDDPMVLELPWRDEQEMEMAKIIENAVSGNGRLAFGVLEHDGVVGLHPPVKRALGIVVTTLERLGHKMIKWEPPSHEIGVGLLHKAWTYDGGADVHRNFRLSGEPIAPLLCQMFGTEPSQQRNASEIAANNVGIREWRKEYLDYWNSTINLTGTGRPVDAVVTPLAPFTAARAERYRYYGYSSWANAADYTAAVFPVTYSDKNIDVKDNYYQPISELDKAVQDDYDAEIYDRSPVSIQIVGGRLQEEKVLALLEYVGSLFKN